VALRTRTGGVNEVFSWHFSSLQDLFVWWALVKVKMIGSGLWEKVEEPLWFFVGKNQFGLLG
jgi:hypothetical protein